MKKVKVKIEVTYPLDHYPRLDEDDLKEMEEIDKKITEKIESIDGKWYAQGVNKISNVRDICFDLEI